MSNPATPARILIFSVAYHPVEGGAEIATKEITSRLPGIEFDMITLRHADAHAASERVGNVDVHRIRAGKVSFPFKAARLARRLHRTRRYDAVWAIMAAHAGAAAWLFRRRAPEVGYVLTLQEGHPIEYMERRSRLVRPLLRRVMSTPDVVQAISTYLVRYARAMGFTGRVEVVPNGVDAEAFRDTGPLRSRAGLTLITTSRLVEKNAVGDIIDALALLPADARLVVIGVGPLEADLRARAAAQGVQERVEFRGHVPHAEIPHHLHHADIFVRPSISEGFGNSFIEAMAAGLPVIATPVGGIVDFVRDGETGVFCEVGNPRSLADQVMRLQADPVLRAALRVNGERLARERYTWDLVAAAMRDRVFMPCLRARSR